jgi:pimeloyl-ACP methyl ester carboxylesterase
MSLTAPPAMKSVAIGAQTLRCVEDGSPDATRALLLFNGIGASIEFAMPFMANFTRTRVIAFDLPGIGELPAPLLPYRMAHVAHLAAKLLDHLGVERVDAFGVSWGGATAQEFANHYPSRCRTLTLAATCAGFVMVPPGRACC